MRHFHIIVVGGGHAGVEAAHIAVQMGLQVALVSMPGVPLASTPCNPSVGGVAKGQVVREIDALGGLMGRLADRSAIQYRTLNESKGFAVQSTRVQVDKERYSLNAEAILAELSALTIIRQKVARVEKKGDHFFLTTEGGESLSCEKLIVTTGTFLNGKLHCGPEQNVGGRIGQDRSAGLKDLFQEIKMLPLRFKTGTPPRLSRQSIDFHLMEAQPSDKNTRNFHILHSPYQRHLEQIDCYLTRTNPQTMAIIRSNKEHSPIFNGQIQGVGPRYCPSIEDKANRYPDRDIHHIFVEPEGIDLDSFYPNGISTSLPQSVQKEFVNSIYGLERAEIVVPGYAVEYDVVDTTYLNQALEYQDLKGLYFAGQVNGTSGYEEAAGQGIVAGINAALSVLEREALFLSRHHSYIGVMVEDLISNRRDEPYRLFTARSENRLYLREDNTLLRMAPYRKALQLNTSLDDYLKKYLHHYELLSQICDEFSYYQNSKTQDRFNQFGYGPVGKQSLLLTDLLRRAELDPVQTLTKELEYFQIDFLQDVIRTVAITKRYDGYIKRSDEQNQKMERLDSQKIYWQRLVESSNISFECRQRIKQIRPETFGQLRLIEGIRAATLAIVAGKLY